MTYRVVLTYHNRFRFKHTSMLTFRDLDRARAYATTLMASGKYASYVFEVL